MREWFATIAGPQYASAIMWTVGALVLLVILLVLIRMTRNLTAGTFIAGGRNRKVRLAVVDAAAVDNQRRLILVRRDEVEHLILIGGPTDVVVEQGIGAIAATPKPLPTRKVDQEMADPRPSPARGDIAAPAIAERRDVPSSSAARRQTEIAERPVPDPVLDQALVEFVTPAPVAHEVVRTRNDPPAPARDVSADPEPPVPPRDVTKEVAVKEEAMTQASVPSQPAVPAVEAVADNGRVKELFPDAGPAPTAVRQARTETPVVASPRYEPSDPAKPATDPRGEDTLEDEMSRLLGELSRERHG